MSSTHGRNSFSSRHDSAPRFLLTLLAVLAMAPSIRAAADAPESYPKTDWAGIYLQGKKVGHSTATVDKLTYAGKPALKESTQSVIRMEMLGQSIQEDESSETITDLKSLPIHQVLDVRSNGSALHLVADYDYAKAKVHCRLGEGASQSTKDIDIPAGANLAADVDFATTGKKLAIGLKFDLYTLDPSTVTLQKVRVEVVGREEVPNEAGVKTPVWVIHEGLTVGDSRAWVTESGVTLKSEMSAGPLKFVMTSESKQHAVNAAFISPAVGADAAPAYTPSPDLAIITSVKVSKQIDDPRKLRSLDAVLSGIPDKRLILSDARQREEITGAGAEPYTASLSIRAEELPTSILKAPVTDPALSKYLQKAPYLETDDPGLKATAAAIRGQKTDSYQIALAVRNWVHQNMLPDASIGVPRSATDIFKRRRGVCRDYATLFAALARICGVPTRLCAGIVYADLNGKPAFYYHAWAECYVGKWIAVDPTLYDASLGIDYVDATHVKFAQGDVTEMYDAVAVVGKLKMEIK